MQVCEGGLLLWMGCVEKGIRTLSTLRECGRMEEELTLYKTGSKKWGEDILTFLDNADTALAIKQAAPLDNRGDMVPWFVTEMGEDIVRFFNLRGTDKRKVVLSTLYSSYHQHNIQFILDIFQHTSNRIFPPDDLPEIVVYPNSIDHIPSILHVMPCGNLDCGFPVIPLVQLSLGQDSRPKHIAPSGFVGGKHCDPKVWENNPYSPYTDQTIYTSLRIIN